MLQLYVFSTMDADKGAHLRSCICGQAITFIMLYGLSKTVKEELQCAREVGNMKIRYATSFL